MFNSGHSVDDIHVSLPCSATNDHQLMRTFTIDNIIIIGPTHVQRSSADRLLNLRPCCHLAVTDIAPSRWFQRRVRCPRRVSRLREFRLCFRFDVRIKVSEAVQVAASWVHDGLSRLKTTLRIIKKKKNIFILPYTDIIQTSKEPVCPRVELILPGHY